MGLLQLLNGNELLLQILNFLVFFFLLRALGWKKVLNWLDARRAKMAADFQDIENKKNELGAVKADYEAKLKDIDDLAKKKLQETAKAGQQMVEDIKRDAYLQAERILDQARLEIRAEVDLARGQLKTHIVNLVMEATEKVIDEKVSMEQDRRIVEDFLAKLDEKS